MKEPKKVTGEECFNWITKPIGFIDKTGSVIDHGRWETFWTYADRYNSQLVTTWTDYTSITKFLHDKNNRKIGYITNRYEDGGLRVILLAQNDETIDLSNPSICKNYYQSLFINVYRHYAQGLIDVTVEKSGPYTMAPNVPPARPSNGCDLDLKVGGITQGLDKVVDFQVDIDSFGGGTAWRPNCISSGVMRSDPSNTKVFGNSVESGINVKANPDLLGDPLAILQGDLYEFGIEQSKKFEAMMPLRFPDWSFFEQWNIDYGDEIHNMNYLAIPYNLILTENLSGAVSYINTGVLPPDAFLYPLDWENLPTWEPNDTPDDDTNSDDDDDNNSLFDGDPDPLEIPSYPPSKQTPNNYYWLSVAQLEGFINWFWSDVGSWSSFDSIINKIEGLYNDLASAVLMVRYMPVQLNWIGGAGTPSNIVVGMIEKNGTVDTINKASPPIIDIGHVTVPKDYKSWASYSPYTKCVLYLPYYGFLDIDMDMFTGHELYVKGVYDYMSGTLQYFIYYEDKYLVNSVVCKMAVDIPITLQSKNDRDSAIFSNVTNAVAGLMGAGTTLATGNPIGLVVGANALTSGVNSAPLSVKGTVGEQGAFYAPSHCKLITQFPVQQKPSKFAYICGKQLNKTMKLNNNSIYGFTTCYNPRIDFKNSTPLQTEIDEIYNLLEKGVII